MLEAGTRIGPYEVLGTIGAGGMGQLYRAQDTRLGRLVALKLLHPQLAGDPDGRARFDREARAISQLSHPHICALHDVGLHDGHPYLVLEFLAGETLANRLRKGPLPLEQALTVGVEMCGALDAAHRRGIVHRDVKPANVMLTATGAKLLDFGLAKPSGAVVGAAASEPTGSLGLTVKGTILGTLQYMAPEQIEGKEADARTDIFAVGLVLHEMVSGRRAFEADSAASQIASILERQPPPVSSLTPGAPAALDEAIRRCLAKDSDERWQSVRDLAHQLLWIRERLGQSEAAPQVARRGRAGWIALAAACGVIGFGAAWRFLPRPQAVARSLVQFEVPPPAGTTFAQRPVVSPDGKYVAFEGYSGSTLRLYLRSLGGTEVTRLVDEASSLAFWSPDGTQLGFLGRGGLQRVNIATREVSTICPLSGGLYGASWAPTGRVVFSASGRLFEVAADGGEPKPLGSQPDDERRYWPAFLPDGKRVLYLSRRPGVEAGIYVMDPESGITKRIVAGNQNAAYAEGSLLYVKGPTLVAQAFELRTLQLSGEPVTLAQSLARMTAGVAGGSYSVSTNGVLAWEPAGSNVVQPTWVNRAGRSLSTVGSPSLWTSPALSLDEHRLVLALAQRGQRDLWIINLSDGAQRRLTFDAGEDANPMWSPDGTRIAFSSNRRGPYEIFTKLADGAGDDELVLASRDQGNSFVEDWSRDGRYLVYNHQPRGPSDVFLLPLVGERRTPIPVTSTHGGDDMGQLDPSGRWLAYRSGVSGQSEVYVRSIAADGTVGSSQWQVSTDGGVEPQWRGDGRELFFLSGADMMAVEVRTTATSFEVGKPTALFSIVDLSTSGGRNRYVVTRDGSRFLMLSPTQASRTPLRIAVNALRPR